MIGICKAEAESNWLVSEEKEKLFVEYENHVSGLKPVSKDRLQKMAVRMLILKEGF